MARFVPTLDRASPHSAAEGKVLRWLAGLDDSWTVLHSVGIADHDTKPWAEADVVLVGRAVLVLEVKGGRVERRDGMWGFRDRHDRITWKPQGPYEQAGGAAAALRRHLMDAGVVDASAPVHWAVVLPDVAMPPAGPEVLREATLDASRRWAPAPVEVERLLAYWTTRVPRVVPLEVAVADAVVECIRGDLSLTPLPKLAAGAVREHQRRLTFEQRALLEAVDDNDRVLVSGRAGTGKSALAMTVARDLAQAGTRTAYVVYNQALARRAAELLRRTGVDVVTIDALALRLVRAAQREVAVPADDAGWQDLRRQAAALGTSQPYGAVVLDEAQDMDRPALALLDAVLSDGLADGVWRAFHDPGQDIFRGAASGGGLSAYHPVRLRLTRNCRSTRQIASATSVLCRLLLDIETPVSGPDVTFVRWTSEGEHDALLADLLRRRCEDYGKDDVLLAGRRRLSADRVARIGEQSGQVLHDVRNGSSGPFLATTSSVKGLEADAVVVHGVDDLGSEQARTFLYTACSRAAVDLTVLLHRSVEEDFQAGGRWLGQELVDAAARRGT